MTQGNFSQCLRFTLSFEGGKSNDLRDPGGRTNQGITQAVYDDWRRKSGRSRKDVFDMPPEDRDAIYKEGYWDKVLGDYLRPGEDLCVWDFAVNSGPARARDIWLRCGGPKAPLDDIVHGLSAYRLSFLHALRTWSYFGAGWGRRVAACEALAIQMAHGEGAAGELAKQAAGAKTHSGRKISQATIGAGAAAGGTAGEHVHAHLNGWTLSMIAAAIAVLVAIFLFNAWRQRQRADALGAAVAEMNNKLALAITAKANANAAADAKEKALAAERDALAAARAAIGKVEIPGAARAPAPPIAHR